MPSEYFLLPSRLIWVSLITRSFLSFNKTVQLSSHSCPMDINEALFNPGNIIAFFARDESNFDKGS